MKEPYVYYAGDPDCPHEEVDQSILTIFPPIHEWKCRKCKRVVRQDGEETKTVMPEVEQTFDADRYPYAKMRLEGDLLYRSANLYGEDEEVPEEFQITDDILRAYNKQEWYRSLYEIQVDLRYNLVTGQVDLMGVADVLLEHPVKLR